MSVVTNINVHAQHIPGHGLLSAEDGPDLEDLLQVRRDGHLLVQLRRLRQTRRLYGMVAE